MQKAYELSQHGKNPQAATRLNERWSAEVEALGNTPHNPGMPSQWQTWTQEKSNQDSRSKTNCAKQNSAKGSGTRASVRQWPPSTLKKNADLFAWTTADVLGVHPDIITHRLSVYKEARPVAQKKRNYGEDKRLAARIEAEKLLKVGFIAEARYSTWLANIVMVKKASGK